ncbi:MAG TPA: BMP family ABC transporter substrate-binding protein, partial [Proteobacteria bacterium]|nr:BMP family ABC transporter substrate-binding protein [Pseudomonadota bacterium]
MFTHKAVRSIFVIFLVVAVAGICGISRAAEKPKEVRIGIITPTVLEEPWNTSFLQALERVQKAAPHGLKVKWDFTENVFNPDAERVLMEYAKTGKYDIIWSHSVYPKAVERLHNKFPDILWVMAGAGNKAYGGNTYWVEMNIQEPAYLMG